MKEWNTSRLKMEVFSRLFQEWAVLTAGNTEHFNAMTINWGGFGTLWQKPVVTVYVKPARYTHEFMMQQKAFTVSFFDERYHRDLVYLGSTSGRTEKKLCQTSLTPECWEDAVVYPQASVTLVCRKIYTLPMVAQGIPQKVADTYYRTEEPHTIFWGEVRKVLLRDDVCGDDATTPQENGESRSECKSEKGVKTKR